MSEYSEEWLARVYRVRVHIIKKKGMAKFVVLNPITRCTAEIERFSRIKNRLYTSQTRAFKLRIRRAQSHKYRAAAARAHMAAVVWRVFAHSSYKHAALLRGSICERDMRAFINIHAVFEDLT